MTVVVGFVVVVVGFGRGRRRLRRRGRSRTSSWAGWSSSSAPSGAGQSTRISAPLGSSTRWRRPRVSPDHQAEAHDRIGLAHRVRLEALRHNDQLGRLLRLTDNVRNNGLADADTDDECHLRVFRCLGSALRPGVDGQDPSQRCCCPRVGAPRRSPWLGVRPERRCRSCRSREERRPSWPACRGCRAIGRTRTANRRALPTGAGGPRRTSRCAGGYRGRQRRTGRAPTGTDAALNVGGSSTGGINTGSARTGCPSQNRRRSRRRSSADAYRLTGFLASSFA